MLLIGIGVLCIIAAILPAATRTLRRRKLNQARRLTDGDKPDTLEPSRSR